MDSNELTGTPTLPPLPMYAERVLHVWQCGNLKVAEWTIGWSEYPTKDGEYSNEGAPEGWARFRTDFNISFTTNVGPIQAQRLVPVPGDDPLKALQWLAMNRDRVVDEMKREAMDDIARKTGRVVKEDKVNGQKKRPYG